MLKQVLEIYELLDDASINGQTVSEYLKSRGAEQIEVKTIQGKSGATDFIKIIFPGTGGKKKAGDAPTLGIIGRLGGIGARPERIGTVSDADGAVAAVSCALKLADMNRKGDVLKGDVIIATHICPNAPTQPHDPVPFMSSPVNMQDMNQWEVNAEMDAILPLTETASFISTVSCNRARPPAPLWWESPSPQKQPYLVVQPVPAMRAMSKRRASSVLKWPKPLRRKNVGSTMKMNSLGWCSYTDR